jgi:hypothetical protein
MGLVISYQLSLPAASVQQVREIMIALRTLSLQLPFAQVDDLIELQGEACSFDIEDLNDPHVFLKLRGVKPIEVAMNGFSWADSTYLIGFDTLPGQGSESAAFGLATHGPILAVNDWSWTGFCKTQYASNPEYGGIDNFVRCHLAIVHLLDEAVKLGIQCSVTDQGNYWETRIIAELIGALRSHNIFLAATTGMIKTAIEPLATTVQAPIIDYPDFEYLEAEGNENPDRST